MNILITGGTGLIGTALSKSLLADGHTITTLSRNPQKTKSPDGVKVTAWDGRTALGWGSLLNEMDAVINLAGENIGTFPWTEARKQKFHDSRVNAGNALLEAFRSAERKPGILVQSSGVGFYGPRGDARFDESTSAGDDFFARLCLDWEASTRPVEDMGVRRVVIRTGIVLSRAGGSLPLMALPVRLFAGGPMGNGRQGVAWIHLEDEVGAIRFLLENAGAAGAFNLSAPAPVSNAEFTRSLARVLHRPYWLPAPVFMLKLALGEMSSLLLDSMFMMPQRLLDHGYKFKFSEIGEAFSDLYTKQN